MTDEGRHRIFVDAVTDYGIYMLDLDGLITSWNSGAQRLKQYEPSEVLGAHVSCFYTLEDREADLPGRALKEAARDGRFENEGWRVRKDGSRFWAHVIIDPIHDSSGKLVGFATITRDLTERRDAKEALRKSEEQFRLLVQSVSDYAIFMLDREGRVTSWNSGASRIKGYQAHEIIGQHFSRFYTEEDQRNGAPQKALETAIREGRFEKEGWRVRNDGVRFWANVVIDPVRNDAGEIVGFAKVTRDITERIEAQRALEETREALYQAQKLEAIGRLTGSVAHDFNNLLTAILGSLELVRKRAPEDEKSLALLDNAIQAAQRGASLTTRMLAFARRQELSLGPVDVPTLVHGMMELLRRSLGPMVAIKTRFPSKLSPVEADANQLEMALLNLAVNARDAMPEGGVITIAAREESVSPGHSAKLSPGRYVRLSVADTGEGMDEEVLARAAEPFFTTKGIGKGTGLGLSVVHGVTEQSGGRLVLKSRKGEGTIAELWLPAVEARPSAARSEPPRNSPGPGRPLVVLVVDDDELVLMNASAMLEDLGHSVCEASSGKRALEILQRERNVDLVITDQAMPKMTGSQLIEAIRHERPDLPIILATGYAETPQVPVDASRLSKPFRQRDLAQAIDQAMADKRD